jgi:serine/threonine protein kinase/Tol biopolymer transport system component
MITRERWQRIKDLFNLALNQPTVERTKFVSDACAGDESLRQEVESLISAHEEEDNFLDAPAHELAAEMFSDAGQLIAGQQLGPYTILSSLGVGGMGEVYLARHVKLGRKVALKLLPWEFARDQQRVRRFEQEYRAAAALNHPNVCVIYEIGEADDGRRFMAMEFIDGITLRRRMTQQRLTWQQALEVALQVAKALEAAHKARIVHRDIKPENIMLLPDGYVKVLDFGIAKLDVHPARQSDAPTIAHFTAPGTRPGTTRYMSPEQLREQPIDARTDIWSLGVVLYEMVTGSTPFEAENPNDTIALILERRPTRLDFSADEVPEELQQIISKALSKKRDQRYQTIRELAADLRTLRRQGSVAVTVELATERLEQPIHSPGATAPGYRQTPAGAPDDATILSKIRSQAIWTADYVLSEIKQHKTAATFAGVTAVFALLFIGWNSPGVFKRKTSNLSLQTMKLRPLTNSGKSVCAAISPDGKSVAHAERKDGMQELVLTGTVTGATSVLVPAGGFEYRGITFSRDNYYVYFTRAEKGEGGVLYQVALPFSPPRKIKDGVDSPISFSPNGDRFAFVRLNKATAEYSLMIAGVDGTDERVLTTRGDGNTISLYGPAWSSDEQTIICSAGQWENDGFRERLVAVNVKSTKETILSNDKWHSVLQVAWRADNSGLIVSAAEQPLSPYQLWTVSYPRGETTRITNDVSEYKGVSFSRDTHAFVSVRSQQSARIWLVPDGDIQQGKDIAGTVGFTYGMSWNSKGRIVFSAMSGSNLNIAAIDPDGANQTALTNNARDNYTPATSPDGGYVVFASNRSGRLNIWRMNAEDGSDLKQLTFSDGNSYPSCSPDGQWVVYDNQSKAGPTIWKVPMDGGPPVQLSREYARMPIVSPDGNFIACRYLAGDGKTREIAILPFAGGPPVKRVPIHIMDWQSVQWTKDGQALTYIALLNGAANIWRYDLASGATKQLTDFKTDLIFAYAWSPDQKQLACERGNESRDVMIFAGEK